MNLPNGARAIVEARRGGFKPAEGVLVSFVGETCYEGPHVYPRPGESYDWRFLRDLEVVIVVQPGRDAAPAMRGIFAETITTSGYPWVIDLEQKSVAALVDSKPLQLWHMRRGSAAWRGFFS